VLRLFCFQPKERCARFAFLSFCFFSEERSIKCLDWITRETTISKRR